MYIGDGVSGPTGYTQLFKDIENNKKSRIHKPKKNRLKAWLRKTAIARLK